MLTVQTFVQSFTKVAGSVIDLTTLTLAQQPDAALQGAQAWLFYPLAALAVLSAVGVVVSQQIVRTAIWLLFTLGSVAFLYLLLHAEFLAVIQLIVYVGGTLILIIFGVMLTSKNPFIRLMAPLKQRIMGGAIGLLGTLIMIWLGFIAAGQLDGPTGDIATGSTAYGVRELGLSLMGRYVLPFELAAVLLLVVMIGAAYMAKGRHDGEGASAGEQPNIGGGRGPGGMAR